MNEPWPFPYVGHGRFRPEPPASQTITWVFRAAPAAAARATIEALATAILTRGRFDWVAGYALRWQSALRPDEMFTKPLAAKLREVYGGGRIDKPLLARYRADLDGFATGAHAIAPIRFVDGGGDTELEAWGAWSRGQLPTIGVGLATTFAVAARWSEPAALRADAELLAEYLWMRSDNLAGEIARNPGMYRPAFRTIVERLEQPGVEPLLRAQLATAFAALVPGLADDETRYAIAVAGWKLAQGNTAGDRLGIEMFVHTVEEIGKRLGRKGSPDYRAIVKRRR